MNDRLLEQVFRQEYRVICDPSWQVQKWYLGQWVTAYYCSTEDGAHRMLEKCVQRALRWSQMTDEERTQSTLR